ncbi:nucleotidyltransferase domain-containing protein [Kribbella sp. NPDC059898]|uniref:nucleotidyltransferase domain-containing protein n=1 Tax=Kribbella sp. NPDC059898 TaxID=3346995 RepID=UPI0036467915
MHSLNAVHAYFAAYPGRYWIAGGWALDLFADRVRREHTDVDVLVLARDLDLVAATFTGPRPAVENPNTGAQRPWVPGETLTPGPDVLAFPDDLFPSPVRIILAASDGDDWVYHRGRGTIREPLDDITLTRDGIPYLAPEIALLFKSRSDRTKDTADFHDVAALLDPSRRTWLHNHIAPRYPEHAWLPELTQ